MEALLKQQSILLTSKSVRSSFTRYKKEQIDWKERFVAIKGLRGVGKTTMMLQYLKNDLGVDQRHLYASLDHPYFYNNDLIELADSFQAGGGEVLILDEVHKMDGWSRKIKHLYDTYPKLQVIISGSSALDIIRAEADLSRRVRIHELPGMSIREYLHLDYGREHQVIKLDELLDTHQTIASELLQAGIKPIKIFNEYLDHGYFPFAQGLELASFQQRLIQTLDTTLVDDLTHLENYSAENTYKIKRLLGAIVDSPPFTVNVSSLASSLKIGRNTVKEYLHTMEKAGVLNFLNREGKGLSRLQKPDKVYVENSNLAEILRPNLDRGNIRETFAVNQLKNAGYEIFLPENGGDILIPELDMTIEIGGKSKKSSQLKNAPTKHKVIFSDNLEIGFQNKIPLYLLGFLY